MAMSLQCTHPPMPMWMADWQGSHVHAKAAGLLCPCEAGPRRFVQVGGDLVQATLGAKLTANQPPRHCNNTTTTTTCTL